MVSAQVNHNALMFSPFLRSIADAHGAMPKDMIALYQTREASHYPTAFSTANALSRRHGLVLEIASGDKYTIKELSLKLWKLLSRNCGGDRRG